ncbi:hypothetical protein [uncultured Porphyromonas sp.]|uniref:hypothetical protein n=1 Tax=uncultured Porphyromonas sp. TaxID=159274 RepID=UPI002602E19E|nr:hypothetical protein [uncultured Porphyromonas sp.]
MPPPGRADAFEFHLARPVQQGLTRRPPSFDTPPLYDDTFIPYAAGGGSPVLGSIVSSWIKFGEF